MHLTAALYLKLLPLSAQFHATLSLSFMSVEEIRAPYLDSDWTGVAKWGRP